MEFTPFGWQHMLVVAVSCVGWGVLVRKGRGRQSDPAFYGCRLGLAASILLINAFWVLFKLLPHRFNIDAALPLHMCDFAWMASCVSLLSSEKPRALVHQLVFFWGLGLSTQAFVQPTLDDGPQTVDFWMFWIPHWQIVAVGLLNFSAFGFRPDWQGMRRTAILSCVLVALVTVVNVLLDTPYCFTGRGTPDNPTVISILGPWPWRIAVLIAIVIGWFGFLTTIFRRRT